MPVYGRVYQDWNGNALRGANDPAVAGQTVYLDLNGNSLLDSGSATNGFTQSTPTDIPDVSTVASSLAVSGLTGSVLDVNVTVNITHTYDGDLVATLISPAGTRAATPHA